MFRFIRKLAIVTLPVFLLSTAASAAVMTFDSFGVATGLVSTAPYTENGITMTPDIALGHYDIYGNIMGGTPTDNVAAIHYGNNAERVRFTFAGGGFNLDSFDLSGWLVRDTDPVLVTVMASSGASVLLSSAIDTPGTIDFSSNSGFQAINWFTIGVPETVNTCNFCSIAGFDDITISEISAVPVPAGLPLALTALFGLMAIGRTRRKEV